MEILESHPLLGRRWRVSLAPAQQNRIENRPESKSERLLGAPGAGCSEEAVAQAQLSYAIPLRLCLVPADWLDGIGVERGVAFVREHLLSWN